MSGAAAPWRVRPARPADAPALGAVHAASKADSADAADIAGQDLAGFAADRAALWARVLRAPRPGELLLLAERGAAPEGLAHALLRGDSAARLTALHVLPGARGSGAGAALVGALAARLAAAGSRRLGLEVSLRNDGARRFYARLGGSAGAAFRDAGGVEIVEMQWDDLPRLAARAAALAAPP
ncbi:hypothetical protein LNKW23_12740 [Paralimibaculum aggregatum]|uniref:N-acetyltransferase domain-containing protein n=1 Tax=Paralimibaculum aggregatum TaxID=3036245 RepID=A0ABQ6LI04_9RHOB|nr:GNAT family N-acetyltransferase [Limibaculum sp. NKW23]GMG82061.1 hypothetical protein LNKW23_12740 [Limibaculum sp. NKW23]